MLLLIFQLGKDWYALDTVQIAEVLPQLNCKKIPQAPAGIMGVFNYHGDPVPLVDLSELSLGESSPAQMSTRIILLNYREPGGESHLLGLRAARITDTIRREKTDFVEAGVSVDGVPFLGPVTKDKRGLIQLVEPGKLLPRSVCDLLFRQPIGV